MCSYEVNWPMYYVVPFKQTPTLLEISRSRLWKSIRLVSGMHSEPLPLRTM